MQDASFHLAAGDGGKDFRAEGALSTSAPSAKRSSIFDLADLACAMPWEDKAPISARLDFKDAVTPEVFVELVTALRSARKLLEKCGPHLQGVEPECCGEYQSDYGAEYMGQREVVPVCCSRPIDLSDHAANELRVIDAAIAKATGEQA